MKPAAYFQQFKTFVEQGIEFMKVNGRPYRVYRPAKDRMFLLPMVSVFDEVAKERNRVIITKEDQYAAN